MGDIDIFFSIISILLLLFIIFFILKYYFYKNFFIKINSQILNKNNFYECGLKPLNQNIPSISITYLLIALFFILYDSELLFIIPFIYSFNFINMTEFYLLLFYLFLIVVSLFIDFDKHALSWQL